MSDEAMGLLFWGCGFFVGFFFFGQTCPVSLELRFVREKNEGVDEILSSSVQIIT